jgi:hypothetical protein
VAITPNTTFTAGNVLTAAQMNRLPWGIMGQASATANQTGITTATDVTGLSVTFTANSTRYYRTTVYVYSSVQNTAAGFPEVRITDGSNVQKQTCVFQLGAGGQAPFHFSVVETGLSGSTTRKARATTTAGTLLLAATSTGPMFIVVEDIGQA